MNRVEVEMRGMHCDGCTRHVEAALREAGAREASVDWRSGHAVITDGDLDEMALEEALAGTRYRVDRISSGRRRAWPGKARRPPTTMTWS